MSNILNPILKAETPVRIIRGPYETLTGKVWEFDSAKGTYKVLLTSSGSLVDVMPDDLELVGEQVATPEVY